MAKLLVFSVRDTKADVFATLVVLPTKGLATRGLIDAMASKQGPMALHPEDYMLYELGTFDESSGEIVGYKTPQFVMSAVEALDIIRQSDEKYQLPLPGVKAEGVK